MPLKGDVTRLFLALGWQAPATRGMVPARALCRAHGQGIDIYLHQTGAQPTAPWTSPLSTSEFAADVLWLSMEEPGAAPTTTAAAAGTAAPSQQPRPVSTHQSPSPQQTGFDSLKAVTLFGVRRVRWGGRWTDLPTAAAASSGSVLELQVFLYDQRAWRQVAWTEAGDDGEEGWLAREVGAGAAPSGDLGDDGPLPLRLALRPAGNPWLRDPDPAATQASAATATTKAPVGATAPAGAASPVAAADVPGGETRAGGRGILPTPMWAPFVLAGWALQRAAGCVARLSATARHVHHMVTCVGATYDLYGSRCLQNHYVAGGAAQLAPRSDPAPDRSDAVTGPRQQPQPHWSIEGPAAAGKAKGKQQGPAAAGGVDGVEFWSGLAAETATSSPPTALRGRAAVAAACLVLSLLLQLLAGPLLAATVWRRRAALMAAAEGVVAAAERLLREQYNWLMTATPAGIKLHAELCALLGTAAHGVLTAAAAVGRWAWPACGPVAVGLMAAGCGLGGVGGGLAVLYDLVALAALPLALQAALSSLLLRRHLAGLRTAWQLMRGRQHHHKRHQLKQRQQQEQQEQQQQQQQRQQQRQEQTQPPQPPQPPLTWSAGAPAPARGAASAMEARAAARRGLGLFQLGDAAAGARRRGQVPVQGEAQGEVGAGGPLLPISRLESLLGLAPDPGSDDEVVVEQLIVGVLLGVPLLGLLPTAVAWRALAGAAWGVPAAARAALAAAAGALRDNAALALAWRGLRPLDFAGPDIMVHCVAAEAGRPAAAGGARARKGSGAWAAWAAMKQWGRPSLAANATIAATGVAASGGGGGGCGVVLVVQPLPLPWRRVAGTWLARGSQGGWGPPATQFLVGEERQKGQRQGKGAAAGGKVAAALRWLWGA